MYQKKVLEKWMKQIKSDEISPEFFGLGNDKEKALEKLRQQINNLQKTDFKYNK